MEELSAEGPNSSGGADLGMLSKPSLGERFRKWCLVYFCYCSHRASDATPTMESHDNHMTARQESHDSHQTPGSRRESNESHTSSRKGSHESHMTEGPESHDSQVGPKPRPRRLKSVTFSDTSDGVHIQSDHASSPGSSPGLGQSHDSTEARFLRRTSTSGTIESMESVPPEFMSLAGRLYNVMKGRGSMFDQTFNEADEEDIEQDPTQHVELAMEVMEKQLRWKISEIESEAENLRLLIKHKLTNGFLPFEFELTKYSELKSCGRVYSSPVISSHPGGYRFRIDVVPGGEGMSEGTHMGVNILSMKGDFDPLLKFPATFIIMIQVINTIANTGHWTREVEAVYSEAGAGKEIGGEFEFLELKRLAYNEQKNTQFLANDTIRFRITRVLFIS